jgi:hypothetical protein
MLQPLIAGAIMLNAWAISLFFLCYWKKTRDQLFACFALAFFLLGVERVVIVTLPGPEDFRHYMIRLLAFLVILFAIWQKNRTKPTS